VILAVVSGKGGVGKSTLSYELGAALDAVVVDADLGMADLPRATRGPDLHDVLAGRADAVEAVRHGPVDLLPCGRSLAGARAADVRALADALRAVERAHGLVVVDCPAGLRADVGVPLAVADACVVVVSPAPFALADALRCRELARELDCGLVAVALNRVVDDAPTASVEDVLGAPTVPVPADPSLGRTLSTGTPTALAAPDAPATDALSALADRVRRAQSAGSTSRSRRST
jgi:septum site-determining protein MinD